MSQYVTFQIELNDADYEVKADIDYHTELNWGSDADGNRGIARTFFDGCEIESIIDLDTHKEVEVTPELEAEAKNYIAENLSSLVEE